MVLYHGMVEVRWHGRGGQGAVTAADLIASAAISEGKYAQSFPFFGPERRGAPVVAFNRIDDKPILVRGEVHEPNIVVVLDRSLLRVVDITKGLKAGGTIIINAPRKETVGHFANYKTHTIDATKIALEVLGRPIFNTAMVGAFAKITGLVSLESVSEAVRNKFPMKIAEKNIQTIKMAYELAE